MAVGGRKIAHGFSLRDLLERPSTCVGRPRVAAPRADAQAVAAALERLTFDQRPGPDEIVATAPEREGDASLLWGSAAGRRSSATRPRRARSPLAEVMASGSVFEVPPGVQTSCRRAPGATPDEVCDRRTSTRPVEP